MISHYHEALAQHYEKYPYPSYPLFALGRWAHLKSVDLESWGASHPVQSAWIVGCGTIAPLMFARRNPRVHIIASDLSRRSLKKAQLRSILHGLHSVEFVQEDLIESHYRETFDAIDCYGVLHHTFSPSLALGKLAKALKTGGVLRLMVYSREARSEIESLRRGVVESSLKSLNEVRKWLRKQAVAKRGDLSNPMGIADALLNPIVHTFDHQAYQDLLATQEKSLREIHREASGNFVSFLQKI
jgi:SAM-dependent methyltransferase